MEKNKSEKKTNKMGCFCMVDLTIFNGIGATEHILYRFDTSTKLNTSYKLSERLVGKCYKVY